MPTNNNWNKTVDNLQFSGNTITASTGNLELVPGSGGIVRAKVDQNSATALVVQNATSGTAGSAVLRSTSASNQVELYALSAAYSTSGPFAANSTVLRGTGSAGLNIVGTNGPLNFYNGASNTYQGTWTTTGRLGVAASTQPIGSVHVLSNQGSVSVANSLIIGQDSATTNPKYGAISHVNTGGISGRGYLAINSIQDNVGYSSIVLASLGGFVGVGGTTSPESPFQIYSNSTSPTTKTGFSIGQDSNTLNYKRGYIEHCTSGGSGGLGYMTLGATSDGVGYGSVLINQTGGTFGVGPSTTPVAQTHINRSSGPTTNTIANAYLHLGAGEALSGTRQMIGFGYTSGGTYIRGGIGWIVESDAGQTLGRIAVMQSSTTADVSPTEIWSWDRNGNITVANSASVPGSNPSSSFYMYANSGVPEFRTSAGRKKAIADIYMGFVDGGTGTLTTTNYNPIYGTNVSVSKGANPGDYTYTFTTAVAYARYHVSVTPQDGDTGFMYRVVNQTVNGFELNTYDATGNAADCSHIFMIAV
jgi:hypothetical protein